MSINRNEEVATFSNQDMATTHCDYTWCTYQEAKGSRIFITILQNIRGIQYICGNISEALSTFTEALHLSHSMLGFQHINLTATLNCIGFLTFHKISYDLDTVICLYQEALTNLCSILGSNHPGVATTLNNIRCLHLTKSNYSDAMSFHSEALTIQCKMLGNKHLDLDAKTYNYGQTQHNCGKLDEAMEVYC